MDIVPPVDIVWHIFPESAYFIRSFSGRPAIADLTIYCTSTLYEVVRACVLISRICKQSGGVLHDSCCILSTSVLFARVGMSVGCASMPPSRTVGSPRNTGPEMRWSAPGVRTQKGALAQPKIYYRSCASVTNIVSIAPTTWSFGLDFREASNCTAKASHNWWRNISLRRHSNPNPSSFNPIFKPHLRDLCASTNNRISIKRSPFSDRHIFCMPTHLLYVTLPRCMHAIIPFGFQPELLHVRH
jgi:hypothetical protein